MDKKIDFKKLTLHILNSYLDASAEEEMDILELLDENMSVIGTGKHEFFQNFQEFYQSLQFDVWQREEVRFEWKDFLIEEVPIDEEHHMVYGSVMILGHLKNAFTCIDMDTRFTILYGYKDGKWKVLHIHHSIPDKEQMNNEEFPNSLGKKVEESRQIIRALTEDYVAVYEIVPERDWGVVIKLDNRILDQMEEEFLETFCYSEAMKKYAKEWVCPEDQKNFLKMVAIDCLKESFLEGREKLEIKYRILFQRNLSHFSVSFIKTSKPTEPLKLVVGFRNIEDVISVQEKNKEELIAAQDEAKRANNAKDELSIVVKELKEEKEKLRKALEEAEIKNEIISAIGKSYYYISRIDLENDSYEVVAGYDNYPNDIKREGCMSGSARQNSNSLVDDAYLEDFLAFIDVSTMAERLEREGTLSMEYRMKNGKWHKARLVIKKTDANGHVTHVLCAIREITDEKRKEQQIVMKAAEARHEVAEKNRFLSNMSHDIRTPVNGIIGLLDIADQFPEDLNLQKKCRSKIKELSRYLVTTVGDILEMNQLQSDQGVPREIMIDITELLRTVNEEEQRKAAKKNIQYQIDWDKSEIEFRYLLGDPIYVQRVLTIVADNAIKFSPAGTTIRVWCKEERIDNGNVSVSFGCEDQGIGMSPKFLEHAFDLFSQEDEGSRTRYQGIGIGLPIAKKIAEKLNGNIQLESKQGVGTKAVTTIPFKVGNLEEEGKVEDCVPASLKGLRALVVEDNELNMEIAKFILEDQGIVVECASDGQEAVDMFEKSEIGHYQMILMDIMMPNLNGRDATRKIRELGRTDARQVPIIAMSANVFADDIIKNQLAGMTGHLAKPLDGEKLLRVVKQCLTKKPL